MVIWNVQGGTGSLDSRFRFAVPVRFQNLHGYFWLKFVGSFSCRQCRHGD